MRGVLLAALAATQGSAYVYNLNHQTGASANGDEYSQSALVLSEGPMFASYKAPFGGEASTIALTYSALAAPATGVAPKVNVHTVFLDPDNKGEAGVRVQNLDTAEYCCTEDLLDTDNCGPGVTLGGFIVHPNGTHKPVVFTTELTSAGTAPVTGKGNVEVTVEGTQYVIIAACDAEGRDGSKLPDVGLAITVEFKNPYGFLPGQLYGYLPFYGFLFVVYLLFTVGFAISAAVQRKYLLNLQYLILATVAFGTLEMAVWFFMYKSKNETGVPTPCNVCPTTNDYLTAVVMNVIKRASSRVMLLAVALGYGVVHDSLPRKTSLAVFALGVVYMLVSVLDSVNRQTSYDIGPSTWEIPVLILDFMFVGWIYLSLNKVKAELDATGKVAKLAMYNRLTMVILANIGAWFLVTLIMVGIRMAALPLPWKSLFIFANFWDVNYLLVLIAIAWIWRPGPDSSQYAFEHVATNEDDADAGPESADFDDVPPPGAFTIQEDNDSDAEDHDIAATAAAVATPSKAASAPPAEASGAKAAKAAKAGAKAEAAGDAATDAAMAAVEAAVGGDDEGSEEEEVVVIKKKKKKSVGGAGAAGASPASPATAAAQ